MFTARWAGVVVAAGMLAGCQPEKPAPPANSQRVPTANYSVEEARTFLQREDPRTVVGRVAEVMPDRNLAAIRDLPPNDFAVSDTLSIVASRSDLQQVALATVVDITSDGIVVVHYTDGTRVPHRGDLAVRMATGPKPLGAPQPGASGGPVAIPQPAAPAETPKETPAPPTPPAAAQSPKEIPAPPVPPSATEPVKEVPAPPVPPAAAKDAPAATETPAPKPADKAPDTDKNK
ncbi:MAG: hypothetical protein JWN24_3784 [Phycisphaerales bacterium]|nr:hypothetical protein [Phycisphaerales bacterium]